MIALEGEDKGLLITLCSPSLLPLLCYSPPDVDDHTSLLLPSSLQ